MFQTETFTIGSWKIKYLPHHEYITWHTILELENFLNTKWLTAVREHPSEDPRATWAGLNKFGIPSPIIRVEMSPCPGEIKNRIFSIGKKPSLLGALAVVARQFPEHRKQISQGLSVPSFDGFIQIGDLVQDDRFVAERILRLPYYTEIPQDTRGKHYWVRVDPHRQYSKYFLKKLDSISLVPVRADGCNTELIDPLRMAWRLSELCGRPPWEDNFVIKPVQGTWGENVEIYHHDDTAEERHSAKERIQDMIRVFGAKNLMVQLYIPDREVKRDGKIYHEIWRLYFVYLDGKYTHTGGMAQGSQSRKVCGIDGTYFIPLLVR